MTKKQAGQNATVIAQNRKAHFHYFIEDVFEVGIVLLGSEVKSLRLNRTNIQEAYISTQDQDLYLINAYISIYEKAAKLEGHEPRRLRKLLLHRKQINKLRQLVERQGYTILPLKLYFNNKGIVKLSAATAKGKKQHDKRQTQKERDWGIEKNRLLKMTKR